MKVLAIIVAAAMVFWCVCVIGARDDERCGWK